VVLPSTSIPAARAKYADMPKALPVRRLQLVQ
jgi:hypothetical protein